MQKAHLKLMKSPKERAAERNRRYANRNRLFPSSILTHPFHLIHHDHPSCHPFSSLISSSYHTPPSPRAHLIMMKDPKKRAADQEKDRNRKCVYLKYVVPNIHPSSPTPFISSIILLAIHSHHSYPHQHFPRLSQGERVREQDH